MRFQLIFFILLLLSSASQASSSKKIISVNFCSDIILLHLADEFHQLSVTYLIQQMDNYVDIPNATQFNRGLLEEIVIFKPDIILAHTFTNQLTQQRLQQLGWSVVQLQAAQNINNIYQNILRVGKAIEREEKAQQLVKQMKIKLQAIPTLQQQRVLIFYPNGFTAGQNSLANSVISQLNLHNIAKEMNIMFWGKVNLEQILQYQPDFIILSNTNVKTPSLATRLLQHPVLQNIPHIEVNNYLWQCGTPLILQTMQHISEKLRDI
jgi:iron complex transport system substrate-binding protein